MCLVLPETAAVAAADAALEEGALQLLTAALRQAVDAARDGDTAAGALCARMCVVTVNLLGRANKAREAAAVAVAPEAAHDVVYAIAERGAADAKLAEAACIALNMLLVRGAPLGSAAAATAGRGVAEALASHASQQHSAAKEAAASTFLLLNDACVWPQQRRELAAAAFFAARGVDALFVAVAGQLGDDAALDNVLWALKAAVVLAPRELVAALSTTEACYVALARAMLCTSLPTKAREHSAYVAQHMAGDNATAHGCMVRTGVLDAAVT
jgi:hypothetical protein